MRNPFHFGTPVVGETFAGREKLIRQIITGIDTGQNLVLFGDRRNGKTSLILESTRQAKVPVLRVDLNSVQDEQDMLTRMRTGLQHLINSSPMRVRLSDALDKARVGFFGSLDGSGFSTLPLHYLKDRTVDSNHQFFTAIKALHEKMPFVVFFDEFQGIFSLSSSACLQGIMRGEIQHQSEIPYIFAGSMRHKMYEMFLNPAAPFYNSAIPVEVKPLPREELLPYVEGCMELGRRKCTHQALESIYSLVDGNTGDIQKLCYYLWNVTDPGDMLQISTLHEGFKEVCEAESPFYEDTLRRLNASQSRVLNMLALLDGRAPYGQEAQRITGGLPLAAIQRAIKKLEEDCLIYQAPREKIYRFTSPFLRIWLLERQYPEGTKAFWDHFVRQPESGNETEDCEEDSLLC